MESTSEDITSKKSVSNNEKYPSTFKDELMPNITSKSNNTSSSLSTNVIVTPPYVTCCSKIESLMWSELYYKDEELKNLKVVNMMSKHSELASYHRSMLLNWLMELCQFSKISRETYYLTMDFFDRYISCSADIKRKDLQFIGITCLRIASKIEEIYPCTSCDLIYISDSIYDVEDMDQMEIKILKAINWRTIIWTPNKWLFSYLHMVKRVLEPMEFMELTELLDMATLDVRSVQYPSSVLAAACLCITLPVPICLLNHPTLTLSQISECSMWLEKFRKVVHTKYKKRPDKINPAIPLQYQCKFLKYSVIQAHSSNLLDSYYEACCSGNVSKRKISLDN